MWTIRRLLPWVAVVILSGTAPRAGETIDVDLQLVLAADVSGSMERSEARLQRQGHVEAFRHPEVELAILHGPLGRIAVTYIEWAGAADQVVVVPWTILSDRAGIAAFARRLAAADMGVRGSHTAISSALLFAAGQFASSGARSLRRTIDISGDGVGDQGPAVAWARDRVVARRIAINGLSLDSSDDAPYAYLSGIGGADVHAYYREHVVGGPGAFAIAADDPADFAAALRRKLILEIASR